MKATARRTAKKRRKPSLRQRYASEYSTWTMIRQRCLNPDCRDYPRYGGRGIKIARRWDSFETFMEDLGPRPKGYSLVRNRPNAGFAPRSCSWQPRAVQQRRRAANRLTEEDAARIRAKYRGGALRADIARHYGVSLAHVCYIVDGSRWKPQPTRRRSVRRTSRRP